jgi:ribonuclease HI
VLCTDFSPLDLPEEMLHHLHSYHIRPVTDSSDLARYNRILIFTDGSSLPAMRRMIPQRADDLGHPDTWAFVIVGEILPTTPQEEAQLEVLGWTAQPVRYDPEGTAFTGVTRIGSDIAERSALIGAALWRISQNHAVPTVFCSDSTACGVQAFGVLGAADPDESYRLLRGLFQVLEFALPQGDLQLHHVRSHAGSLFNEIADLAAKKEAQASMNLPRQALDMQKWRKILPHLDAVWRQVGFANVAKWNP